MLAAIQAPVIMMSQNRQDAKDRLRSELDFAVKSTGRGRDPGSGEEAERDCRTAGRH